MNQSLRSSCLRALVFVSSILLIVVAVCSSTVLAQAATKRLVYVTVTDPLGRFVIGVERTNFGIVENGVRRAITDFTELRNEYLIEFEAANPSADVQVVLQQPRGLPPLRANLQAATKRLVHVTVTDPLGRFVIGVERANFGIVENGVRRAITDFTELRNEYLIEFEAANPSADAQVVLQQPRGLPPLQANIQR